MFVLSGCGTAPSARRGVETRGADVSSTPSHRSRPPRVPAKPRVSSPAPDEEPGGVEVAPDAPPRVRKAADRARRAEEDRAGSEQRALAAVRRFPPPPPFAGQATTNGAGDEPATPSATTPSAGNGGDSGPETLSSAPPDEEPAPAAPPEPPPPPAAEPARPVEPGPEVPPEIRAAIEDLARANREVDRGCAGLRREIKIGGTVRIIPNGNPLCEKRKVPPELVAWLPYVGYTLDDVS